MLVDEQLTKYHQDGFVLVENALTEAQLVKLQQVTADYVELSRSVSENSDVFELDIGHSPDTPRLTRIKTPHRLHEAYYEVLTDENIMSILRQLLGNNIRIQNSKLNTKAGQGGAAVHWHQDWAFYPHTNDDLLAIGIMLSDTTESDGPLQMVPGSHRGPVLPHSSNGVFCGAIDPEHPDARLDEAVSLTGKAGSMSIHHVRTLHGSAPNSSNSPRLLLLFECAAADAWPIAGSQSIFTGLDQAATWKLMSDGVISGEQSLLPRLSEVPIVMPLPPAPDSSSIFRVQASGGAKSSFETPSVKTPSVKTPVSGQASDRISDSRPNTIEQ